MGLGDCCKLPSRVRVGIPEETGFSESWGLKITSFCPQHIIHHLPIILMANFNDFAFMLGMSIFDQVWLKLQQGGKPEQGRDEPLATRHFNH